MKLPYGLALIPGGGWWAWSCGPACLSCLLFAPVKPGECWNDSESISFAYWRIILPGHRETIAEETNPNMPPGGIT
jgi:hypothetical protein